jgi:ABC-type uncharacterized transport system fused permease/ATPase subunit
MFLLTFRVTSVRAMPGVYRLYYPSRRVGEAVTTSCWIRMDFNCRSDRRHVACVFQRQAFLRRINGRVGGFNQVNQSLRWFVDNFALLADWRAALSRVIKFREALLMSEHDYEQKNRVLHLRDFANHLRLGYGVASKGNRAVLDPIERDVPQHLVVLLDPVESERSRRSMETLLTSGPHGDGLSLSPARETI